jgi:hypothetical protein
MKLLNLLKKQPKVEEKKDPVDVLYKDYEPDISLAPDPEYLKACFDLFQHKEAVNTVCNRLYKALMVTLAVEGTEVKSLDELKTLRTLIKSFPLYVKNGTATYLESLKEDKKK